MIMMSTNNDTEDTDTGDVGYPRSGAGEMERVSSASSSDDREGEKWVEDQAHSLEWTTGSEDEEDLAGEFLEAGFLNDNNPTGEFAPPKVSPGKRKREAPGEPSQVLTDQASDDEPTRGSGQRQGATAPSPSTSRDRNDSFRRKQRKTRRQTTGRPGPGGRMIGEDRIIQTNANHSSTAQDLLLQTMAELDIGLAVVAEPYRVPANNAVGDATSTVMVLRAGSPSSPDIYEIERGNGFAAVTWGDLAVVGVYASPNAPVTALQELLDGVRSCRRRLGSRETLILGDFNAKATAWGSPRTDPRGAAVVEWAAELGLLLLNVGSTSTCVRWQGESIVDLSWASRSAARRLNTWRVASELETLSDHRYIIIALRAGNTVPPRDDSRPPEAEDDTDEQRGNTSRGKWVVSKMDRARLETAAEAVAWCDQLRGTDTLDAQSQAVRLRDQITGICNEAMPRAKPSARKAVYWWSPDLEAKRRECTRARHRLHRRTRYGAAEGEEEEQLRAALKTATKALKTAIAEAKNKAWEELIQTLDRDPWGRPYRIVLGRLRARASSLTELMRPALLEEVLDTLFPRSPGHAAPTNSRPGNEEAVAPVTDAELAAAARKMRKNAAPGPDGIPGVAVALALPALSEIVARLFNACLREGTVPACWKTSRLVLLPKPGKKPGEAAAYRPICILDEMGKLFERVVLTRMSECLEKDGPDLHHRQYGFRTGRSTLDAMGRVVNIARKAINRGERALAVSVDIVNAFNSISWEAIKSGMRDHRLPAYLCRIVGNYLCGRTTACDGRNGLHTRPIERGVPQGSVLGPTLWNIGYDVVLRTPLPMGVSITCYADDTLLVAVDKSWTRAVRLMETGLAAVTRRIASLGLEVAAHKMEAVWFHGLPRNRNPPQLWIKVGNQDRIPVGHTLKYLGLVLDERLTFEQHLTQLAPRVERTALHLGRLLPNIGGPQARTRRLYNTVIQSMTLYGTPIWAQGTQMTRKNRDTLRRMQRGLAIRLSRGYRTISTEVALTLAGLIPFDLLAEEMAEVYWGSRLSDNGQSPGSPAENPELLRARALSRARERWKQELLHGRASEKRAVAAVMHSWDDWAEAGPTLLTYRITQVITGHGCFGEYLRRIGAEETPVCHHCGAESDTAEHTVEMCEAFGTQRRDLIAAIGPNLSATALISALLAGGDRQRAVTLFCEEVMRLKESTERDREQRSRKRKRRRSRRHLPARLGGDEA